VGYVGKRVMYTWSWGAFGPVFVRGASLTALAHEEVLALMPAKSGP